MQSLASRVVEVERLLNSARECFDRAAPLANLLPPLKRPASNSLLVAFGFTNIYENFLVPSFARVRSVGSRSIGMIFPPTKAAITAPTWPRLVPTKSGVESSVQAFRAATSTASIPAIMPNAATKIIQPVCVDVIVSPQRCALLNDRCDPRTSDSETAGLPHAGRPHCRPTKLWDNPPPSRPPRPRARASFEPPRVNRSDR